VRPRNEEHLFQCANDAGDANDAPVSCRNYLICSVHSKSHSGWPPGGRFRKWRRNGLVVGVNCGMMTI